MKKIIQTLCLSLFILFVGAQNNAYVSETNSSNKIKEIDILVNDKYEVGDSRRYGVFPDSINNRINPRTGKSLLTSILDFAEAHNITLNFPKGYYGLNLILDSRKNISCYFNQAEFNLVHITNDKGAKSSNINFKGTLILYDRFDTYNSHNIKADSIIIRTDTVKHLSKLRSRGCHIYKGTESLHIKYLRVEDLGSGTKYYQNNHAALALDGLRENPKNITIDEVYIESSDRHGAYITGSNNVFKKITINSYGQGTTQFMTGYARLN
ncbi:hypothetical protein [Pseudotamlana carrageenivorans]|uniref:Pectate lyase superfamily protein domain-containing protein n=1 Tax=Pseudotamlana carrageenivorans TaxID=2069432 RepID=A0A2I7SH39_9FLAO|nr:hypothetical protein [Tamlana carrageenivorans]AUS05218.1 hypothetical protein C1A40_06920 [Tamlana carrageenivorans]